MKECAVVSTGEGASIPVDEAEIRNLPFENPCILAAVGKEDKCWTMLSIGSPR